MRKNDALTPPSTHLYTSVGGSNGNSCEDETTENLSVVLIDNAQINSSSSSSSSSSSADYHHDQQLDQQQQHTDHSSRRWTVALFSVCTVLLFADQNLMSPNLTAIARDFNFTDQERDTKLGGAIALAFFVVGAPASFVVGCLGDHCTIFPKNKNRAILFASTVLIGEGACMATYFSKTYSQLYVFRAITGFSIGGALPLVYSILGDLFAAEERHVVTALVGIGTGMGISLGQGVAGFLGPTYGWRLPFLVISIPALLCALLVLFTVNDPPRGGMERVVLQLATIPQAQHNDDGELPDQQEEGQVHHPSSRNKTNDIINNNNNTVTIIDVDDANHHDVSEIETVPLERRADSDSASAVSGGDALRQSSSSSSTTLQAVGSHNVSLNATTTTTTTIAGTTTTSATTTTSPARTPFWILQLWYDGFHDFATLLSTPTVVLALLQGAPGCVPWGIVNTYLNDFLSEDRGMSVQLATLVVLIFGVGNFIGQLVGGGGGSYLYRMDRRYPALLAGSAALLGCLPFWMLLNINVRSNNGDNNNNNNNNSMYNNTNTTTTTTTWTPSAIPTTSSSFVWIALIAISAGALSGVTGPVIKATLQNVTLPQTRGQAFALFNTFDDFGRGLGPVVIAYMIRTLGGRTPAFNVGVGGWILCGFFNLLVFVTVERDEDVVQATILASQSQTTQHIEDS